MHLEIEADRVLWDILDDEAVIIHVDSSEYFGLNVTGTWLWQQLVEAPRSEDDLARALTATGHPEREAAHEASAFAQALVEADLVASEATPGKGGAGPTTNLGSAPADPAAPTLTKLGELETLLLSGE